MQFPMLNFLVLPRVLRLNLNSLWCVLSPGRSRHITHTCPGCLHLSLQVSAQISLLLRSTPPTLPPLQMTSPTWFSVVLPLIMIFNSVIFFLQLLLLLLLLVVVVVIVHWLSPQLVCIFHEVRGCICLVHRDDPVPGIS